MLPFAPDRQMRKVDKLAQEFYEKVLWDEEPLFISDEAKIWDVSTSTADELIERCRLVYQKNVTAEDFTQPLWKLLKQLNEDRSA
jgi:hypothetical protein